MRRRRPNHCCFLPAVGLREQDYQNVQRVLEGEESLWDLLYQEARAKVLSAAKTEDHRGLLPSYEYQEIADEAFTRCYEQLDRFEGRSRFASWVCGYAKNLTRNRCARHFTRLRNQKLFEAAQRNQMAGCDPLQIIVRLERDQCLWSAFFAMDPTERVILYQWIFCHTAPKTLAKQLQLTRREVIQRYHYGLIALRCKFLQLYCWGIQP